MEEVETRLIASLQRTYAILAYAILAYAILAYAILAYAILAYAIRLYLPLRIGSQVRPIPNFLKIL